MRVEVYDNNRLLLERQFPGSVELGRISLATLPDPPRTPDPPAPSREQFVYCWQRSEQRWRVVLARVEEDTVSRQHVLLEPVGTGVICVRNCSSLQGIGLPDGGLLGPGASRDLPVPLDLTVGPRTVRVLADEEDAEAGNLHSLSGETMAPGQEGDRIPWPLVAGRQAEGGMEVETLVRWLQTALGVLHSAASSADFFDKAAQALVDRVGLETGWVLLWQDGDWKVETMRSVAGAETHRPSKQLLNQVRTSRRTSWAESLPNAERAVSLIDIQSVVAAPILDPAREVIGALYGDRRVGSAPGKTEPIGKVEALLVELLAGGVATGLARQAHEQAALAARIQFEQFFTPELAQELARDPHLLDGKKEEVTVLFADLRGFSRLTEKLGPEDTFGWLQDLLSELSDCVRRRGGVLVDYIGDELFAMWGAPKPAPDHAWLACQAALDMLERLQATNARWTAVVGAPLSVGIGLNTGPARVGNVGSRYKFKYGPLGNTVNLGSRVQGATKYLSRPLLVTEATWQQVKGRCAGRRLASVRVVNIDRPVHLYELVCPPSPGWAELGAGYEDALTLFEAGQLQEAVRRLGQLLAHHSDDGPVRVLLMRSMQALMQPAARFDPVWELPGK